MRLVCALFAAFICNFQVENLSSVLERQQDGVARIVEEYNRLESAVAALQNQVAELENRKVHFATCRLPET